MKRSCFIFLFSITVNQALASGNQVIENCINPKHSTKLVIQSHADRKTLVAEFIDYSILNSVYYTQSAVQRRPDGYAGEGMKVQIQTNNGKRWATVSILPDSVSAEPQIYPNLLCRNARAE